MTETIAGEPDEHQLVRRVAGGDERAYGLLVRRHAAPIRTVCRRFLGNDADADEVLQDVFLTLWRSAGQYRADRGRLSTWLYRIAANRCRDRLRRRGRWLFFGLDLLQFHASGEPATDQVLESRQDAADVRSDITDLPERQRMALLLASVGERSAAEIGDILDISPGAAEQLIVRARRTLRDKQRQRAEATERRTT